MATKRDSTAEAPAFLTLVPEATPAPANELGPSRPSGIRFTEPRPAAADGVDRVELGLLLSQKRFDEALAMLLEAQRTAPDDAALARGIAAIQEHLVKRFARWIGGLDRVLVQVMDPEPEIRRSPRFSHVLDLVGDGAALQEILEGTQLSRHETTRLLSALMRLCVIGIVQPDRAA